MEAVLTPDELDPLETQNLKRADLYKAFGAFAVSLPAPLVLWGVGFDYRVKAALPGVSAVERDV